MKPSPAPSKPLGPSWRHDAAARRKAQQRGRERGCWVYIPAEVLIEAGFPLDVDTFYRTVGHQRSRNGHSVIVTLYREP